MTHGKAKKLFLIGAIVLILPLLISLLNLYVDWLFFVETGFTSVLVRTLSAKITTGVLFGAAFLCFIPAQCECPDITAPVCNLNQKNYAQTNMR